MGPQPRRPPELHRRVFRGSAVVRSGRLTENELRSSAWRRLHRDVYVCATVPVTHRVRAMGAALAVRRSAISGRSAAVLWGVDAAGAGDDVELTVPPGAGVSTLPGVRVRRRALDPAQVLRRSGVPVTSAALTALDLAGRLPGSDGTALVDRLVRSGATDLAAVRALASTARGPWSARARRAVARADGLAESPQETRLRLLLRDSVVPDPVAQHVVRDADGRFVARVDFAWPDHRIALEYEGTWHGERQQVGKDRARLNRLTGCGWRVVFVTAADLRDPARLLLRLAAELGS
ncbi:hypothetical protein [Blastococcus montanus]|uniref:hypothetical protein n=1 Tax=Blastococcus montanus TaxID=3144973 RepID=UPI003209D055